MGYVSERTENLMKFPDKPYRNTDFYVDSIKLKEIMYRISNKELDHRAKYRDGNDISVSCSSICKTLLKIYIEREEDSKLKLIKELLVCCGDLMSTLKAIDISNVHMSHKSYSAMLEILEKYVVAAKYALSIEW